MRIYHLTRTTGEPEIAASFLSSGSDVSFAFKSSRTGVNLWTHIKLQDGISWYHVYKLYFWPPCNWATMRLELLEKLLKVAMRIPPAVRSSILKKAGNSLTWVELLIAGLLVVKCRELLDLRLLVVELELLLAGLLVAKWPHTKRRQIFILKSWPIKLQHARQAVQLAEVALTNQIAAGHAGRLGYPRQARTNQIAAGQPVHTLANTDNS